MVPLISHWAHLFGIYCSYSLTLQGSITQKAFDLRASAGTKISSFCICETKAAQRLSIFTQMGWPQASHPNSSPQSALMLSVSLNLQGFPRRGSWNLFRAPDWHWNLLRYSAAQGGWGEHKQIGKYKGTFNSQFLVDWAFSEIEFALDHQI